MRCIVLGLMGGCFPLVEQLPGGIGVARDGAQARPDGMRPRPDQSVEHAQPLAIAALELAPEVEGVMDERHEEGCVCGVTIPVPAVDLVGGRLEDEGSQDAWHGYVVGAVAFGDGDDSQALQGLVAAGDLDGLQWWDRGRLPAWRAVVRGQDVDGLVVLGSGETVQMFAIHGWFWFEAEFAYCGDRCAQCFGGRDEVAEDVDVLGGAGWCAPSGETVSHHHLSSDELP